VDVPRPGRAAATKAGADAFARCAPLLDRVDSADLDCVSDNVALLLAHAGVADVRTPFALDWRFDLRERPDGLPRLDLPPAGLPELLAERTGFTLDWRPVGPLAEAVPEWREALAEGEPVLVVGDAFHLPWVPYQGHKHLDHGFVVEGLEDGVAHVADAYDNVTQWGRSEPLATTVPVDDLAAALEDGRWTLLVPVGDPRPLDVAARLAENAAAILEAERDGSYRRFVEAHREPDEPTLDNLTLQTWLLARNRSLHARWLADQEGLGDLAERFEREIVAAWRRAAETAYMALRRVSAGRQAPPATFQAAEAAVAAEPALAAELLPVAKV
jgi:Butirosin biosynthesis protein H, N-terminal